MPTQCIHYITTVMVLCLSLACNPQGERIDQASSVDTANRQDSQDLQEQFGAKADQEQSFPVFQDLAIIVPKESDQIKALDVLPESWLDAVDEALFKSEIGEFISDESWPEEWQLVAMRVSPCSPLGKIADAEEIDRLCWPEVRLVFQPIAKKVRHLSIIQDHYADDRAIHALYRLSPDTEVLRKIQTELAEDQRLSNIEPSVLAEFENLRDQNAQFLLEQVYSLRQNQTLGNSDSKPSDADYPNYSLPDERLEYFDDESALEFSQKLFERVLTPFCQTQALHELTAFSLPLGRNPASAELWSFVGFHQVDGRLEQSNLKILSAHSASLLYEFKGEGDLKSEDVTTTDGDIQFMKDFENLEHEVQNQLLEQVVMDPRTETKVKARVADPYQTLVSHTSCASCHRDNNLLFNFHNLSYFEAQDISIAPRTLNDVKRDIAWSQALLSR